MSSIRLRVRYARQSNGMHISSIRALFFKKKILQIYAQGFEFKEGASCVMKLLRLQNKFSS
jgi:hypothetical protein